MVLLTLKVISQDSVTCLPNEQLKIAIKLIERGKTDSMRVELLTRNIDILNARINSRDSAILQYEKREISFSLLMANYDKQILNYQKNDTLSTTWVAQLQKDLRRQRTRTVVVGVAGLVGIFLTAYLTTR